MLILLPPSETKRDGGNRLEGWGAAPRQFPELSGARATVRHALETLVAGDDDAAIARSLKVGARGAEAEVRRNRSLATAPLMPALDRYTGVLYDALDAPGLTPQARQRAGESLVVHSALFGLVGALDPIPAYRLSHDSRLPGLTLKRVWAEPIAAALASYAGAIVDLRSAGYAALGPLPNRANAVEVSVVSRGADGTVRALNHFNKRGKGLFVRELLTAGALPSDIDALLARAARLGWELSRSGERRLQLVVPDGR